VWGSYADLERAKTSIPVPEVHSYSVDPTNDVGAPYILMDYIYGTVATELREAKKCDVGLAHRIKTGSSGSNAGRQWPESKSR